MEFSGARKRGRFDSPLNGNGGFKKSRPELESLSTGIGSKSKPCTKFFSTSGCPFGEGCHFLHYVPGGVKAVNQMIGANQPVAPPPRNVLPPPQSFPEGSPPAFKNRLCNKYNSAEGCKFGDKCYFAHGEWELGKPTAPSFDDHHHHQHQHHQQQQQRGMGPIHGRMGRAEPPPAHGPAASFGLSATAKISVDASLAGAIIGKNGTNCKQISRMTGAKLSIRDCENPNMRNVELEGTFDQIKQASAMVRELIENVGPGGGSHHHQTKNHHHGGGGGGGGGHHPGSNFKTKICDNFIKGSCTFGDRCHFAHGNEELRKSAAM